MQVDLCLVNQYSLIITSLLYLLVKPLSIVQIWQVRTMDTCILQAMHESYEASQVIHVHAGGLFLPETPNSLVERGYLSEAKSVLQKVRGTKDVDVEFDTIVLANEALKGMESPWKAIFRRRNRPQLILAIAMPFFQCDCPFCNPSCFVTMLPCRCIICMSFDCMC